MHIIIFLLFVIGIAVISSPLNQHLDLPSCQTAKNIFMYLIISSRIFCLLFLTFSESIL